MRRLGKSLRKERLLSHWSLVASGKKALSFFKYRLSAQDWSLQSKVRGTDVTLCDSKYPHHQQEPARSMFS
ncbi:hypothetical protein Mal48_15320 [Thalassoglobus polymorphus]|uniref:Uncharacterized protein n=1 Tax=Thalassoglobus polymorphus TaxID=2527994 RepID=A0A517QKW5_9PLAN|nr:hypothetical protein Mal48_15320 [Thalassoglobus polymorphus]